MSDVSPEPSTTQKAVVETTVRVRYAETDAMGIVHHSSYVVWLELGRSDWMRQRGKSYADLESEGYHLPVVSLSLRYLASARYDELVTLRTWVSESRSRQIRFSYEVIGDRGVLARGETVHVCLNRDGAVVALPEGVRQLLSSLGSQTRP